ncbi:MAG: pentapeptide repeat-containing protein [Alphaproteobacteria bacterium]|nr:pentapeptide repeat-containing protein [Alphaproteobacteria bacterium]
MVDDDNNLKLKNIRSRIESYYSEQSHAADDDVDVLWSAVSLFGDGNANLSNFSNGVDFAGKNLENGKFANENLQNALFTVANLTRVDFSGANLSGVNFSGANLTEANLSGADLTGAVLSGAVLKGANFTGAKLNGVKLQEADLENAILLDIEIDQLGIEELQELIEYLAKYYPHKLNLTKMNLTLLNLQKIDLKNVNLKGVDFTGCDFTGVNIMELDLSECIISPEQIAQALGRVPGKEELARILAPKKKKQDSFKGIDTTSLFLGDGKEFGVLDFTNDKGVSVETLLKIGKKVFRHGAKKPDVKDEEVLSNIKSEQEIEAKNHNSELRKTIEDRKRKELESRAAKKKEFMQEVLKENQTNETPKRKEFKEQFVNRGRDSR